jgi:hypothetical protein
MSYETIPQPIGNMLVLRKTGYDTRDWRHFNTFEVLGSSGFIEPPKRLSSVIENRIMRLHRAVHKILLPPGTRQWPIGTPKAREAEFEISQGKGGGAS